MKKMRSHLENGTAVSSTACGPSTEALGNVPDTMGPCFASNEGSSFKENMNINKFDTPKLAIEPLQMKKKKRGGGFNLRKSLAWDRAFFTEEGVLDPQELSVISGASSKEGLSSINEYTPVGSRLPSKPAGMQKLKHNIFTKLQNEDLSKDIKKDASSLRLDSSSCNLIASSSLASHKVPTLVGCNKSGSSSRDIPRPISLSSLKRPANANIGRAAEKELKLLKVPSSKPGLSPICATTKKTTPRVNHMKHTHSTPAGLKSSCGSVKKSQNASKSLQSTLFSDGNSNLQDNSPYRRHSSINMSPVLVVEVDNSVRPGHASESRHELATSAALLSQNAHFIGRTMHPLQNQVLKPSGLRMPSPSLSFFSQPKPSVLRDMSLRGTGTDACNLKRHENSRLKEILRTTKVDDKIQQFTVDSKAITSRSVCTASPNISAVASNKLIMEQGRIQKVQDCSTKNRIEKISDKEVELQSIDNQMASQSESQELVMNEISLKKDRDCYPQKSESCEGGRKNSELWLKQKHTIQESETILAVDESSEEKETSNLLFLNHGSIVGTQSEGKINHGVQKSLINRSDGEDACKSDCHGLHSGDSDSTEYPLGTTDQNNYLLKLRESEQLDATQQSGSIETLGCRISKSGNSYSESKDLQADPSNEASVSGVLTQTLFSGQSHAACYPNIGECKNFISVIPDVGDDTKQQVSMVKNSSPKSGMESQENVEFNTSGRLPQRQKCLEEQNIEKLTFLFPDREVGSKAGETKMVSSLSLGKQHDPDLDRDKIIGQTLLSIGSGSVDYSMSPDRHNNVINRPFDRNAKHEGGTNNTNYMLNNLHEGSQRTENDSLSLSPVSSSHEVSTENTLGKVSEMGTIVLVQNHSTDTQLTLPVSFKEYESDMNNQRSVQGSGTEQVQPSESCMLNEFCAQQSEHLALTHAKFGAENCGQSNAGLHFENFLQTKNLSDEFREDNVLGIKKDSIIGENKLNTTIYKSLSILDEESPLEHGSRCDAYRTSGKSQIADSTTDHQRVCPLSDTAESEASEDNNSCSRCVHPWLDTTKEEATLAPALENMHGDGLNEKTSLSVLPQNAIPFSDEWIAAIEAAGEDILTKKSGAVQNSPPDKSLPEPSPWSPVKKRNNQIGPFDCTKFNNNHPSSDSLT